MFSFSRRPARKPALIGVEKLEDRITPVVTPLNDTFSAAVGQITSITSLQGLLANDFSPDNPFSKLVAAQTTPAVAASGKQALPPDTVTVYPDGSLQIRVPSTLLTGDSISFTYRATDITTNQFGDATVTINLTGGGKQRLFATATGPGTTATVRVFDNVTGVEKFSFVPYEASFTAGVRVATGDINEDGVDDILVAPAIGGGARVVIYDGNSGAKAEDFFVFEPTFRGGADVAVGDVNGDQVKDVIIGAGDGGGPRVVVYDGKATARFTNPPVPSTLSSTKLMDFFAYESTFRNGVRVAAGDLQGLRQTDPNNARDFIVTGSGFGGGPAVKVFDGKIAANQLLLGIAEPSPQAAFFSGDSNYRGGINVAVGQFRGDGKADIVTGAGNGTASVRVYDGRSYALLREFVAGTADIPSGGSTNGNSDSSNTFGVPNAGGAPSNLFSSGGSKTSAEGGVRVAAVDRNGDDLADIVTGPGPGVAPRVRIYDGNSLQEVSNFLAFPSTFLGGVYVGANAY